MPRKVPGPAHTLSAIDAVGEAKNRRGGTVEPTVRPLRWLCQSCGWTGDDGELLRAPSPFDASGTIVGCPKCKAVEDIANACDEPGCTREATCGFPDPGGYRRTCGEHFKWWDERPNVEAKRALPAQED